MVSIPYVIFLNQQWFKNCIALSIMSVCGVTNTPLFKNIPFIVFQASHSAPLSPVENAERAIQRCFCLPTLGPHVCIKPLLSALQRPITDHWLSVCSQEPWLELSPSPVHFQCPVPLGTQPLFQPGGQCSPHHPDGEHRRLDKQGENLFPLPSLSDVTMHNSFQIPAPKRGGRIELIALPWLEYKQRRKKTSPLT